MRTERIIWDYAVEEVYKVFHTLPIEKAANIVGMSIGRFTPLDSEEREQALFEAILKDRTVMDKVMVKVLPQDIEIPHDMASVYDNREERNKKISEWLTKTYEHDVALFTLDIDQPKECWECKYFTEDDRCRLVDVKRGRWCRCVTWTRRW